MSRLVVFPHAEESGCTPILDTSDGAHIGAALQAHGIRFEQHALPANAAEMDSDAVLAAMADTIAALKESFGYQSCDVVKVTPETPNVAKARAGLKQLGA